MKIIVLHGDNIEKSFERLTKFIEAAKERGWEILEDEISLTPSLFASDRLTVIRDFKLINKKVLGKATGTLVIYNEGVLKKTFLDSLPKNAKIEEFKLPKLLWKFLDNMNVNLFHDVLKTEPAEFVFAMIAWKLRKNYLKNPTDRVAEQIDILSDIDYKVKTGKADLVSSLDLLILKYLQ